MRPGLLGLALTLGCGAEPADPDGCAVGQTAPCTCDDGADGVRACVSPPDGWSACGCVDDGATDLFVPPPAPEPLTCPSDDGPRDCPPYRGDDVTEAGAEPCCTADDACGSEASFLFGEQCVARDGPRGTPSEACPDEFPNFLDLYGCCRPDGQCGLSIDHISNWDVGCIERSEMAQLLDEGSRERDALSLVFLLPVEDAGFTSLSCDP